MYYRISDEQQKLIDIFKSHFIGFSPILREDAPTEVVEAYKTFMEFGKKLFKNV